MLLHNIVRDAAAITQCARHNTTHAEQFAARKSRPLSNVATIQYKLLSPLSRLCFPAVQASTQCSIALTGSRIYVMLNTNLYFL